MTALEGTTVDRYQVECLVGRGGMGEVYRAKHTVLGSLVALKFLSNDAESPEAVARFVREARASAAVDSPHIAKVSDFARTEAGLPFLVMEWIDGVSLEDELRAGVAFSVERTVAIVRQILLALGAAHAAGVVHRDVKPSNVMLTTGAAGQSDFVKILDFGLSKTVPTIDDLAITRSGVLMGTPGYMAPEQLDDPRAVDARADLFSVAVMLFSMLSATMPFDGDDAPARLWAIAHHEPKALRSVAPHVPHALAHVVDRGLSRDPARRWATAEAFLAALDESIAPTPARVPPARGRRRVALIIGAGLMTCGLLVAFVLSFSGLRFASRSETSNAARSEAPRLGSDASISNGGARSATDGGTMTAASRQPARTTTPGELDADTPTSAVRSLVDAGGEIGTLRPSADGFAAPAIPSPTVTPPPGVALRPTAAPFEIVEVSSTGVQIAVVRSASFANVESVRASLRAALAPLEACRRIGVTDSLVLFAIIDPWGRYLTVSPSRENTGDRIVARCAARAVRSVRDSGLGTGGLQRYAVTLPAH